MEIKETFLVDRTDPSDLSTQPHEAIILMAHGSRDEEGAEEFLTFVGRLAARLARPIYAGFLELANPPIMSAIDEAVQAGARTIIAIPWLLLGAGHAKNDMPTAIQWARERHPHIAIRYGSPLNMQPELLAVMADRLAAIDPDTGLGSPTTAVLLVQRGSGDPEANAEVARAARLLWEGRNYRTVEIAFSGITWPTVEQGLQRCLVHGVSRILIVPYYLYTGILVKRISQTVAEVAALHPECEFRIAQHMGQDTRLEILAQRMIEQTKSGKATVSCDMCQYRVPLFGREALVGLPQGSDHAHGLRGMTMHEHTHEEHHHIQHDEHEHPKPEEHTHDDHEHTHEHTHSSASFAINAWKDLCECVTSAGIMDRQEITAALTARQSKKQTAAALLPYLLTAMPGQPPTAALRWDFDSRRVREFADWCTTILQERFGITWQIIYEDEDPHLGPQVLHIRQGELQERCDWRYLNESHWMGAFCTIANRLLEPTGITALCLETGWFDTVLVCCHKQYAEELLNWFPEAE